MLEHIVAHCTEAETKTSDGEPKYTDDYLAEFARTKLQAKRDLGAARAG